MTTNHFQSPVTLPITLTTPSQKSKNTGKLTFQEGALVQAVRKGWWIVLDELNLAPSDVLEALNRLLDDNRELFVPELQETIKPHPHFALFATQNPPGVTYGGRKVLSKAFRNRFMEIHVILNKRCGVAPSYASKIVEVMRVRIARFQSPGTYVCRLSRVHCLSIHRPTQD
jgi:midasin (ATPase involved in ribosome maturation)